MSTSSIGPTLNGIEIFLRIGGRGPLSAGRTRAGCLVDRDRVDVGVGRRAGRDLGVLVLGAGLAAGLAEAEAGGLEQGDGVEDLVEAGRARRGQALDLLALRELRVTRSLPSLPSDCSASARWTASVAMISAV